ncbi:hypothetical protein [Serinibacter arcticus]|uniref:Lipoprotein n=1 Tax=Serinibacter arcticus TaxID=1655435 RepID=A0A4Z1E6L2_9MICO|nr:hypothetical protein [Serinibacter arcticus]TGO05317.1 hypothetical protein SERN_1321 [Serinibacter arcticus]
MGLLLRTRRTAPVLTTAAVLAATLLTACGGGGGGAPSGPEAACGDPVAVDGVTLAGLTAEDVLLVESSFRLEEVVVYDDGRVAVVGRTATEWTRALERRASGEAAATAAAALVARTAVVVPAMAWLPHPESPSLLVGQLPDCALDDLASLARELGDVVATTNGDLGDPMITDSPTTTLDYRGDPAVEASAYALTQDFEDGLTREERRGRAFMRAMLDTVTFNLPDVGEVAPEAFEFYPDGSGACEPITDPDDVAAVLAAYEEGDDDVEARAVPPGIEPCT